MTVTAFNERRELAHRTSDGIEVTLFWNEPANQVTVEILDSRSGEGLEFEVEGQCALEAFNHPYAYAATAKAPKVLHVDDAAREGAGTIS